MTVSNLSSDVRVPFGDSLVCDCYLHSPQESDKVQGIGGDVAETIDRVVYMNGGVGDKISTVGKELYQFFVVARGDVFCEETVLWEIAMKSLVNWESYWGVAVCFKGQRGQGSRPGGWS